MVLIKNDVILLMQPKMIDIYGKNGAALLNQIGYWEKKCSLDIEGYKWFFSTAAELARQIRCSRTTIKYYLKRFVEDGLIVIEKLHCNRMRRVNFYRICYDKIIKIFSMESAETKGLTDSKNHRVSKHPIGRKLTNAMVENRPMLLNRLTKKSLINLNKSIGINEQDEQPIKQKINYLREERDVETSVKTIEESFEERKEERRRVSSRIEEDGHDHRASLHKPSNTTCQDLLFMWNEIVSPDKPEVMSKSLAPLFVACYKMKFKENYEEWVDYCNLVKDRRSEAFVPHIRWALKFSVIDEILAAKGGGKKTFEAGRFLGRHMWSRPEQKVLNDLEPEEVWYPGKYGAKAKTKISYMERGKIGKVIGKMLDIMDQSMGVNRSVHKIEKEVMHSRENRDEIANLFAELRKGLET